MTFTWFSKKQQIVSSSTCEVEYMTASSCVSHTIWLRKFLKEMQVPQYKAINCKIYANNKSIFNLAKNPIYEEKSKHIDVCFHSIWKHMKEKEIKAIHAKSHDQVAKTSPNLSRYITSTSSKLLEWLMKKDEV